MLLKGRMSLKVRLLVVVAVAVGGGSAAQAAELLVGAATVSITPDRPVALAGQMHTRIAREVESEVTASALALESRSGARILDQAIMVACDLVAIRQGILERVRERARARLPEFDLEKLFLSATHTHTAPVMTEGRYEIPDDDVMRPAEYVEFLVERLAEVAAEAWERRRPGGVSWGLGHAVVTANRRAVYADGRAQMYGRTDRPDFRRIEGYEDHGVEVLFFWDEQQRLKATAINVACPAQEVEGRSAVNADFWASVREQLRRKYGSDLVVIGWIGAAGDQSPHLMYRRQADERMRNLRGLTRLEEIARRLVGAWEEAYQGARQEVHTEVVLKHEVKTIQLPYRRVTEQEAEDAADEVRKLSDDPANRWRVRWHQSVLDRFEGQRAGIDQQYPMELHVIRLGDVAIATNDFELFTDFGVQIKARSRALQTFVIQLAGPGTYVPTERAVRGGGYSAIVQSSHVGPEGGQELVERTVGLINSLWPDP